MEMQTLALAFLTTVTVGGLAWVFIYPLLSGEKQAEKRRASFTRSETSIRVDDRVRTRRVQVEESMKELEKPYIAFSRSAGDNPAITSPAIGPSLAANPQTRPWRISL